MVLDIKSALRLSSGHFMPRLGFGVYQNYDATPSVLEAFKAGYRHVDTAQVYRNEAAVGAALLQSGLKREDVFITTKCVSNNHGYEKTLTGVDESLTKIPGGYIDLFLIHNPHSGTKLRLETYKALLECKAAGKIRDVGVSNYGVHHLEEIRESGMEMPAVNQIELHPLCQQRPIVEYCTARNIVVQAYCPILRGELDNPVFLEIAEKHKREPAQIVIRWSLQKGFVPLPKSATPSRIHSNANVFDFALDDEDMARIDALDKGKEGAISWNPVDEP